MAERPTGCCGVCPPIVGGGYDCTCAGNPRCPKQTTPRRIQRKRTKGWRMPEGAKYVGRPGKWGNPYTAGTPEQNVSMYRDLIERTSRSIVEPKLLHDGYGVWDRDIRDNIRRELAGHDLACWCPLDQPCHADVLLEICREVD